MAKEKDNKKKDNKNNNSVQASVKYDIEKLADKFINFIKKEIGQTLEVPSKYIPSEMEPFYERFYKQLDFLSKLDKSQYFTNEQIKQLEPLLYDKLELEKQYDFFCKGLNDILGCRQLDMFFRKLPGLSTKDNVPFFQESRFYLQESYLFSKGNFNEAINYFLARKNLYEEEKLEIEFTEWDADIIEQLLNELDNEVEDKELLDNDNEMNLVENDSTSHKIVQFDKSPTELSFAGNSKTKDYISWLKNNQSYNNLIELNLISLNIKTLNIQELKLKLPLLKELNISDIKLGEIDVSPLKSIEKISVSMCDLRKITGIDKVPIKYLLIAYNNFSELTITAPLELLDIRHNNDLTTLTILSSVNDLDISGNENLTNLQLFSLPEKFSYENSGIESPDKIKLLGSIDSQNNDNIELSENNSE